MPTIAGLRIEIRPTGIYPALYAFHDVGIVGRTVYLNDRNNADLEFRSCRLQGGIVDSAGFGDTGNITLSACLVDDYMELVAKGTIRCDSCQITGHVVIGGSPSVAIFACTLEASGPHRSHAAIRSEGHVGCHLSQNIIRGYYAGIVVNGDDALISKNRIENCTDVGIDAAHGNIVVVDNVIQQCGQGLRTDSSGLVSVCRNTLVDLQGHGIVAGGETEVVENVVRGCEGDGIRVSNYVRVRQNTSCFNGGSGYFSASDPYQGGQEWVGNIGYGNERYGVSWADADVAVDTCNDWFGNSLGATEGRAPSNEDMAVDPDFCDSGNGDLHLDSSSPLLGRAGCSEIGALGVGCGVTGTLVQRFTASRVRDGVRVVWEVASGSTATEIWLERSEAAAGGGWIRPFVERSYEGSTVVALDRSAEGRAYWYRLMTLERSVAAVIGAPIHVGAQPRPGFRLEEVGPNPGGGPLRIAFALGRTAAVEINVFDVQGRNVSAPVRGNWSAGTHEVVWDGRARGGDIAPAGMYVVRYTYPGGQERRTIIRVR